MREAFGKQRRRIIGVLVLVLLLPIYVFSDQFVADPSPLSSVAIPNVVSASSAIPAAADQTAPLIAEFGLEQVSTDVRFVANWIADSRDNGYRDFIIVDKKSARLHTFDANARLRQSSAILLGSASGDDSVPGIGSKPIAQVRPSERTTPAGRFVGQRGRNTAGEDVIWVDYDAAVSMHRVRATNAKERRLERLVTPTINDKRISYGCINVPTAFYEAHINPLFRAARAIIYILPEVRTTQQVFGAYATTATSRGDVAR
jgi:hypothetical protein